jgi:putative membrane protein
MDCLMETVKLFLKGGVIGIANVIPGVSGGTMAVVLGIYEYLIEAIGNFFVNKTKRKEYFLFLLKVLCGTGAAILIFSWVMDYLLTNYPVYTYLFFIGLILGSIPSIYKTHPDMKLNFASILTFMFGAALILVIFFLAPDRTETVEATEGVKAFDLPQALFLILSGFLSGGSMIMPGISGSFILVLLGQYHYIIRSVKNLELLPLIFLGIGIAIGIWSFAKMIDVLLKRNPKETFYFILGLVFASLVPIFPGLPAGGLEKLIALFIAITAFILSYKLGDRPGK